MIQDGILYYYIYFCIISTLILDEADRLLEVGFEASLREILNTPSYKMPAVKDRQTLLFSATFPVQVSNLALNYMRGSACISLNLIDKQDESLMTQVVPEWGSQGSKKFTDKLCQLTLIIPKQIHQSLLLVEGHSGTNLYQCIKNLIVEFQSKYSKSGMFLFIQ